MKWGASHCCTDCRKTQTLAYDSEESHVLHGEIDSVVIELEALLSVRRTKQKKRWLNYIIDRCLKHRRMDDSTSRSHNMPIDVA